VGGGADLAEHLNAERGTVRERAWEPPHVSSRLPREPSLSPSHDSPFLLELLSPPSPADRYLSIADGGSLGQGHDGVGAPGRCL